MYVFVKRLQSLSFQAGSRCLDKLLLSPPQRHVARVDPHGGLVWLASVSTFKSHRTLPLPKNIQFLWWNYFHLISFLSLGLFCGCHCLCALIIINHQSSIISHPNVSMRRGLLTVLPLSFARFLGSLSFRMRRMLGQSIIGMKVFPFRQISSNTSSSIAKFCEACGVEDKARDVRISVNMSVRSVCQSSGPYSGTLVWRGLTIWHFARVHYNLSCDLWALTDARLIQSPTCVVFSRRGRHVSHVTIC